MRVVPPWVVHRLLDVVDVGGTSFATVMDPCARLGDIKDAFESWQGEAPPIRWIQNDVNPDAPVPFHWDYLGEGIAFERVDMSIFLPPKPDELRYVVRALAHSKQVCALIRFDWLSGAKRHTFLRQTTPDIFPVPETISFDGVSQETSKYCWLRWPSRSVGIYPLDKTPTATRHSQMTTTRQLMLEAAGQLRLPHTRKQQ